MKDSWKIIAMISTMLIGAGVSYVNIEDDLSTNPLKEYKFRSLDREMYITFHHSATKGQTISEISKFHVYKKGWPGIAYHFAINWKGDVFQLQKLDEITYHSKGHNTESIGIVFIGNFQERELPDIAVKSAELLVKGLEDCLDINGIRGHRDIRATLCPGDKAYEKIKYLFY